MCGYGQKSCEYYDVSKNQWTQFASLNQKIYFASASILGNKFIYLFGGGMIGGGKDTICKYDISDNTWAVLNCKLE